MEQAVMAASVENIRDKHSFAKDLGTGYFTIMVIDNQRHPEAQKCYVKCIHFCWGLGEAKVSHEESCNGWA